MMLFDLLDPIVPNGCRAGSVLTFEIGLLEGLKRGDRLIVSSDHQRSATLNLAEQSPWLDSLVVGLERILPSNLCCGYNCSNL